MITDSSGNRSQLAEYTPFGSFTANTITQQPNNSITHYFTGKELDSGGLYYYGARYYSPATAHFTQPDPLIQDIYDPQSLNHYSYCRNNPLIYTDPTGMSYDSLSNIFNNWSTSISNTIKDMNNSISNVLNSIKAFTQNTYTNISTDLYKLNQGFNQIFNNISTNIGSGMARIGSGINYLENYALSAIGNFKTIVKSWQENNVSLGFKSIPEYPFVFHTGIIVSSSGLGTKNWGFNPEKLNIDVLFGKAVPGKIYINEPFQFSVPISFDRDYALVEYNYLQSIENLPAPKYVLYGPNTNNCFKWRDKQLNAGFSIYKSRNTYE